jgi:hypothetical protein
MPLPRAVQEQADAADALMASMGQTVAVDPETGEPIQPAEPVVAATPTPEPAAVAPAPAATEPAADEWKHKYFTLKGMFDAEVPRLNTQVKELTAKVNDLVNRPAPQPVAPAQQQTQLITDKDRESFGPDLVDLIDRGVRQATQPLQTEIAQLRNENAQLKQTTTNVQQANTQTAEHLFLAAMERAVPDLKTVNVDPGFLAWLAEVDPIYNFPRKVAFDSSVQRRNVEQCAAIFNAYRATKAPAAPAQKPRNELATQVTPARTRASAAPTEVQKINWTPQSIENFYNELRRGAIPTDEAARLEADLNAALSEGRIS